ncbi:hypothetical protein J3E61_000583 [Mycobacterium sp. OAE908]
MLTTEGTNKQTASPVALVTGEGARTKRWNQALGALTLT